MLLQKKNLLGLKFCAKYAKQTKRFAYKTGK